MWKIYLCTCPNLKKCFSASFPLLLLKFYSDTAIKFLRKKIIFFSDTFEHKIRIFCYLATPYEFPDFPAFPGENLPSLGMALLWYTPLVSFILSWVEPAWEWNLAKVPSRNPQVSRTLQTRQSVEAFITCGKKIKSICTVEALKVK